MRRKIEMPEVTKCKADSCAYNRDGGCHARAVTIGGDGDHKCDTMMASASHTLRTDIAGVGACKVMECAHNVDFECQAEGIEVMLSGGQADCATYSER